MEPDILDFVIDIINYSKVEPMPFDQIKSVENAIQSAYQNGWNASLDFIKEKTKEFHTKALELNKKIQENSFEDIPNYADVMSLSDFKYSVDGGLFIPDDGDGYYISGNKMSKISVWSNNSVPEWATGVAWFNK